ncbi:unnamed protein product [Spirodela intermedia]|uniref:procollagen-proline 4-dioxygenase n=1 Tax=Spirodela intermedia TaxID=51605 RepID=A0A7I8IY09_SPIIN|nr:unnamed protein product [Spirodela intermedia]CAA6662854.1 unnamed protein product [Spirodela intermedia]
MAGWLFCCCTSRGIDLRRVTQLSWNPRAFLYHGFLSDAECDHLVKLAKDKLEKSMVADNDSGESVMSEVRTSSGMFLSKNQRRIASWTFLPEENGEAIQILHYEHGQKGHRVATVLMYLSDVQKGGGGGDLFPNAEGKLAQEKEDTWSECASDGYAAEEGDALLFFSLHPNATTDNFSLHGSCPVIEGEKWSATKWIHVRSFDTRSNELCSSWAATGECERNPSYRAGSDGASGFCRKSCGVC